MTSAYLNRASDLFRDGTDLIRFIDHLFSARVFDAGFELAPCLVAPEGTTLASYVRWAESNLPEAGEHPQQIGLPRHSATFLAEKRGADFVASLRQLRSLDEEDETV